MKQPCKESTDTARSEAGEVWQVLLIVGNDAVVGKLEIVKEVQADFDKGVCGGGPDLGMASGAQIIWETMGDSSWSFWSSFPCDLLTSGRNS